MHLITLHTSQIFIVIILILIVVVGFVMITIINRLGLFNYYPFYEVLDLFYIFSFYVVCDKNKEMQNKRSYCSNINMKIIKV